jgi:hypothetical protein
VHRDEKPPIWPIKLLEFEALNFFQKSTLVNYHLNVAIIS